MTQVEETILVFAFRYSLGRCSAAPSFMVDYLIQHWSQLSNQTQTQIMRELTEEFDRDDRARLRGDRTLGWDCDRSTWDRLRKMWNPA